jgi:hypothetical protein
MQWLFFYPLASFRHLTSARDAGLERAAAVETLAAQTHRQPALLLTNDDSLFSFWYAQTILGRGTQGRTYWGPALRYYTNRNRLVDLVDQLQKQHPVALAQWDEAVDRKYPYVPITPSGNLCLASRRALPAPATRLASAPGMPDAITTAGFHVPVLKEQECAAFVVKFFNPQWGVTPVKSETIDTVNNAMQTGWVEVLIARRGLLHNPPPNQPDIKQPGALLASYEAWRQTRRLVIPRSTPPGAALQAVVPTMIELQAPIDDCDVWTRLVRSRTDTSTPWTRAGKVRITQK